MVAFPIMTTEFVCRHCQMSPGWQSCPLLRITGRWTPFFPENLVTPPEDFLSSGFILTRPCLCRVSVQMNVVPPSTSQRQVEPEPSWETRGTPAELSPEPTGNSSSDGVSITVGLQGPHTAGKSGSFWLNSLHSSWSQRLKHHILGPT